MMMLALLHKYTEIPMLCSGYEEDNVDVINDQHGGLSLSILLIRRSKLELAPKKPCSR